MSCLILFYLVLSYLVFPFPFSSLEGRSGGVCMLCFFSSFCLTRSCVRHLCCRSFCPFIPPLLPLSRFPFSSLEGRSGGVCMLSFFSFRYIDNSITRFLGLPLRRGLSTFYFSLSTFHSQFSILNSQFSILNNLHISKFFCTFAPDLKVPSASRMDARFTLLPFFPDSAPIASRRKVKSTPMAS